MREVKIGKAVISPLGPVEAGSYVPLTFTYTVEHPVDDSGYILVCFRNAGDFGQLQFTDPDAPNYTTVSTTGNCRITPRWDNKGFTRPWNRCLFLQVGRGYLDKRDRVQVVFGDRSGGSPGWQMQTFSEETFEFKTFVDPISTFKFKELPQSPVIRIVPGKPVRAVCIAPSEITTREGFFYCLKLEDRWGNPVRKPSRRRHSGFKEQGIKRVTAKDLGTGISAESNPILVVSGRRSLHPYWADFHGQSEETIGTGSIQEYFSFAQEYGLLNIIGHQGNDFQITDEFWDKINHTAEEYYQPGKFVTYPGYEWSGNTPLGGDRNVFFTKEGARITRSSTDLLAEDCSVFPDSRTAKDLFKNLRVQDIPSFVFAHVGGRYADIEMHDPVLELAVEIHSSWGTFEWLVDEALKRGHRVGIVANSDDHKCRPGASYPGSGEFGSLGGITCVLARSLDRQGVYQALRARRCYATTGNRCLVDVTVITPDGRKAMMGDILRNVTGQPELHVSVAGSAPVESVEVRNGLDIVKNISPQAAEVSGSRIKITWSGAEVPGRARITRWDGSLKIRDNRILKATPVNFWNANQPLKQTGDTSLSWKSNTTGGLAGIIMELEKAETGVIEIVTLQGELTANVSAIVTEPQIWEYGGLRKKITLYRLPGENEVREFSFSLPLINLHSGDNPIYIRMMQEDGHMAWSSPVYITKRV